MGHHHQRTGPAPRADHRTRASGEFVARGVQYESIVESGRIFYRADVHQFGGLPAAAPLGADDLADLDLLHAETYAEGMRLRAALFTQVALGRAVIELVVDRIADRGRGMADQRNMPVAAQRGPCGGSVVVGIGRIVGGLRNTPKGPNCRNVRFGSKADIRQRDWLSPWAESEDEISLGPKEKPGSPGAGLSEWEELYRRNIGATESQANAHAHVRFSPESGHSATCALWPLRAKSGHPRRQLFDDLIGSGSSSGSYRAQNFSFGIGAPAQIDRALPTNIPAAFKSANAARRLVGASGRIIGLWGEVWSASVAHVAARTVKGCPSPGSPPSFGSPPLLGIKFLNNFVRPMTRLFYGARPPFGRLPKDCGWWPAVGP